MEILSENDPDEEYPASDEDQHSVVKYRWEWKILYSGKSEWQPYIKSEKWFHTLEECKRDGKDFDFNVDCIASLKLCIQLWHNNDCILELYYGENEL